MYNNRKVYFYERIYSVFNIHQLITPLSNIFQRNLAIVLAIYWRLSKRNCIQICLDLTFLLYDDQEVTFSRTQCIFTQAMATHKINAANHCTLILCVTTALVLTHSLVQGAPKKTQGLQHHNFATVSKMSRKKFFKCQKSLFVYSN